MKLKIFRQCMKVLLPGYDKGTDKGRWRWSLQHLIRALGPRVSGPPSLTAPDVPDREPPSLAGTPAPTANDASRRRKELEAEGEDKTSCCCCCSPWTLLKWAVVLMLTGVVSVCTGVFILAVDPYNLIFNAKVQLNDGSETYELWRKPPVDLFLKIWLFNVTNADDFLSGKDKKIRFEEVGPYVYRELLEHEVLEWNDNYTVTAQPKHPLVWAPEMNTHREDDLLILPNIALLSISNVMRDSSYFTRLGLNLLVKQTDSHPLVQMTAREFFFGYETPLTTLGNKVLPSWIFFDKIGLIDRMYDFTGDSMTINTGMDDVRKSGTFDSYRGLHYVPEWPENCSIVSGSSDSSKFGSRIRPDDQLAMYRKSLCRVMPMMLVNTTTVAGMEGYVYTWKDGILDNGRRDPHNKCFCRHNNCLPEGILDVEQCYYGFPIALSYPHFYLADPSVANMTEGSKPEKEKHETKFIVEPKSGLVLHASVRMQINMALGDLRGIPRAAPFSNLILPMLWLEISCEKLPNYLENRFFFYLQVAPVMLKVILYCSLIAGPLLLIASIVRVYWNTCSERLRKEDFNIDTDFSRKHMNIIRADRRASLKAKEMDTYFTSLLMSPSIDEEQNSSSKDNESV